MEDKIIEVINEIKPYLNSDGGDIEFVKYEDNVVYIKFFGACSGCAHRNETYQKEYLLTLCHKRVYYPTYKLNYYNPLSFIFDLRVRDIASYLKNKFFGACSGCAHRNETIKNLVLSMLQDEIPEVKDVIEY